MAEEVEETTEESTTAEDIVVEGSQATETGEPTEKKEEAPKKRTRKRTKKVKLEVTYSKLNYKGTIYSVGDILELPQEEADALLEVLSGRQHQHLRHVD